MRLFVGVGVSDAVRDEAERVAARLRQALGAGANARWVPPANHHLTVRFVGHVPTDRAAALLDALARPLASAPFDLEFGGCGRFPPRGAPRVLWIGLRRGLSELTALHEEFNRRVAPFGYEPETRPFSAHLTLARFKDAPRAAARSIDDALASISMAPLTLHVDRVTIFESHLSPNGPRYTSVREIQLQTR